jgi:nucleotide-binding universal stress UspA family protein
MLDQIDRTKRRVFDRIVCAIDSSPQSLEAARQAERLQDPLGTLRLAAVTDTRRAAYAGWSLPPILTELDAESSAALRRATAEIGHTTSRHTVGNPIDRLLEQVDDVSATLVAVGAHGRSRALGIALGSVATGLLHKAPCSVLVARPPRAEWPFPSSILVGADGSPGSLAAAEVAKGLAGRFDAELVVVAATGGGDVDLDALHALTPFVIVDTGRPVEALVELAEESDLLVVGSRGLHGLKALGSVSERVGHRAPCSVLVVR